MNTITHISHLTQLPTTMTFIELPGRELTLQTIGQSLYRNDAKK